MLEEILRKAGLGDVLIVILGSLAIVGFWRGMWNLMDKYLFPGYFLLSQLTSISVGIIILILLSEYK